jgi:6-phosphogluconolactonase
MKALSIAGAVLACTLAVNARASRVYFGTSNSKGIYVAELDASTGTLSKLRLALEIGRPGFLAIHPSGKFLYALSYGGTLGRRGGVAAMKINRDGTLSLINQRATEGEGACHVSIDKTGRCLMAAYYGSGSVASFRILEDGSLSDAISYVAHEGSGEHPKRQTRPYAHSIFANPQNTHAYVCDLGIDKVMIYQLDPAAGSLTPAGYAAVPGGARGPRHMKWNAKGTVAYVLNELDLTLSVFKAMDEGQMQLLKTVSVMPEEADASDMTCAEIRIHPNGKFVYTSNRDLTDQGRDSITVFACYEDGLERLDTVLTPTRVPRNFNIDPSGRWLLVGGQRSHDVAVFRVDPETGRIAFTGTKVPFDGGPICIEFME